MVLVEQRGELWARRLLFLIQILLENPYGAAAQGGGVAALLEIKLGGSWVAIQNTATTCGANTHSYHMWRARSSEGGYYCARKADTSALRRRILLRSEGGYFCARALPTRPDSVSCGRTR